MRIPFIVQRFFLEALWLMSSWIAPPATLLRRKRSDDDVAQGAAGGESVEGVARNQDQLPVVAGDL